MKAEDLPAAVWRALGAACTDRQHGWRTPVLATVDAQGDPQARMVVLRAADSAAHTLRFFTDRRSPKVAELQVQPRAQLVFWHVELRWQLRVQVRIEVVASGPAIDAAWQRLSATAAANDYLGPLPPGAPVNTDVRHSTAPHHFAVLHARVDMLDWLELAAQGHRRARWQTGCLPGWVQP